MATLRTDEKQVLEKLFQMGGGNVLNFSHRTLAEFFWTDLRIDISDAKYNYASGSKANRMRGFWQVADDASVGKCIAHLLNYIETDVDLGTLRREDFPSEYIKRGHAISARLIVRTLPNMTRLVGL